MNGIKILSKTASEQNAFYDPDKANNGGGYSQPLKKTTFEWQGEEYEFVYDDMSCGDFGSRFTKTLYKNGEELAETEVNQVGRNEVYRYGFRWDNPLHLEMYRAGLLSQWDFYEEEEDDEE